MHILKFRHIVTVCGIKLNNLNKKDSVKSNLRICTIFFLWLKTDYSLSNFLSVWISDDCSLGVIWIKFWMTFIASSDKSYSWRREDKDELLLNAYIEKIEKNKIKNNYTLSKCSSCKEIKNDLFKFTTFYDILLYLYFHKKFYV